MTWQAYLETHKERFLSELFDFIRIPSVSAEPKYAADVRKAAQWVAQRLEAAGAEHINIMETGGHPVVYADYLHAGPNKPTVLLYGHFDVQPPDPLELWETPAFEPTIRNGRIYARGASDDKGGMLTPIIGFEAMLKTAGIEGINIKFCFEGQEEIGSPQLEAFLEKHQETFACDYIFSADGLQWSETEAMIVLGLKGMAKLELDVYGPSSDLHSGLHGGVLMNPLEALARTLASLRHADGKIAVEGFYDAVIDPTIEERAEIARVPFDEHNYQQSLGIKEFFGEPGFNTRERNWLRPTLDINGIWGGYQGEGSKTVIPSSAHAKITCRLVAKQNPKDIAEKLELHIKKHCPPSVRVEMRSAGSSEAASMSAQHPGNKIVKDVLAELYGMEPYYTRLGGTIPVGAFFKKSVGVDMIGFGWSLASENLHAPNEFFPLESFYRGQRGYCMLLERLSKSQ